MSDNSQPTSNKLHFSLDLRAITALLVLAMIAMAFLCKPWANVTSADRTITVTGEAKITEAPDEYTFYPTYEFKNASKDTALADLSKKSDEITKKLKELGVSDGKIKVNSDGYDYNYYNFDDTSKQFTYTLRPTAIVANRELAQKVQDYLVSTSPTGQISPQTGFSTTKQKQLESKARDDATKDARAKADQSAKNLGFKVAKVKSIQDGTNFGGITPMMLKDSAAGSSEAITSSLAVQPGQNDLTYSVTVIYYIK